MHSAEQPILRQAIRSLGVIGLCACAAWFMQAHFDPANLILVFMAGVVYIAARSDRAVSLCSLALSIGLFDLVFVEPRWGFKPSRPQDVFTLAVMVAVGLLVTELASRVRREATAARLRADRLQALNALSLALAAASDEKAVERSVCRTLHDSLGVHARVVTAAGVETKDLADNLGDVIVDHEPPSDPAALEFIAGASAQARLALARLASEARSEAAAVEAASERLRNTLLSGISHDFRTPLTTIVGATASLIEQEDTLEANTRRELLRSVLREARRLHTMTSTLLDLSRAQEGALQPTFEWCHADELVQEVLRTSRPWMEGRDVRVSVDPESPVWCDPALIERVLSNLLDNATRHTHVGGRIDITARRSAGYWELEVSDDGPGIPKGEEERIFQKFVHGATGRGGAGLGLALCTAIAQLHAGTITARNDAGAVFTLRIAQPDHGLEGLEP